MFSTHRRKREKGQGLVEFALVLPALLLTIMGIADFGRLFAAYSNLFNAAREGARYGVVNPMDIDGINGTVQDKISLTDPQTAQIYVHFDGGPNTPQKNYDALTVGDRVIVTVNQDVEMLTPFIRVIAKQLHVETVASRTISSLGEIGTGSSPPAPPTATPVDGGTGLEGGTETPEPTFVWPNTPTPAPTATYTPTPSPTPSPTPGPAPIQIDIPLWEGDMQVTGTAEPGEVVYLRDIQNPDLNLSATVAPDGTFRFDLPGPLVAGHVIAVQGYGSIDYAIVEGSTTPTATPTATATPAPTPTPSSHYISVDPWCGFEGSNTITVEGHQWPVNKGNFDLFWDNAYQKTIPARSDFTVDIAVDATTGSHTITVETTKKGRKYSASKSFTVPCPSTPTPTPSQPNLVVESLLLNNQGELSTYDPLTFTVAVRNIGTAAANSLFWVDLYTDPAVEPPTPSDLMNEGSVAWAAVSSLAQNETISLTLYYPEGFVTTGDHAAYALADTWDQVLESNEEDNVGGPLAITVSQEGTPPAPTPTPTPSGTDNGTISGSTWLYINGDVVPQGRVNVYLYDGINLIAETLSDQDGNYLLTDIPPGTYSVLGETYIDGTLYQDTVPSVEVQSGQITEHVTLVLH